MVDESKEANRDSWSEHTPSECSLCSALFCLTHDRIVGEFDS
jgi:hypothetical protein